MSSPSTCTRESTECKLCGLVWCGVVLCCFEVVFLLSPLLFPLLPLFPLHSIVLCKMFSFSIVCDSYVYLLL